MDTFDTTIAPEVDLGGSISREAEQESQVETLCVAAQAALQAFELSEPDDTEVSEEGFRSAKARLNHILAVVRREPLRDMKDAVAKRALYRELRNTLPGHDPRITGLGEDLLDQVMDLVGAG